MELQPPQPHSASANFLCEQQQKTKSSELAMPRRQRRVWETIASMESYSDLSHVMLDETPTRAVAEQRATCDVLSRPSASPQAEELTAENVVAHRSVAQQRSYCCRLAQKPRPEAASRSSPRAPLPQVTHASQRRSIERLAEARQTAAPRPGDLSDVESDLAVLRNRKRPGFFLTAGNLSPFVTPRRQRVHSRRPKSAPRKLNVEVEPDNQEMVELRQVIEELLWVSLLTLRSCPCGDVKTMSQGMTSRLNGIILDVIRPVLQPMARFVLPQGSAIVRRLQKEWPELTTHLRLHMAAKCKWNSDEIHRRIALVRECRDFLLAKDFTKSLAHRLEKLGSEKSESLCSLRGEKIPVEVCTEAS